MNPNVQQPIRIVKKVKGHGGHHGGAWKVAYADFVTAMMALFIVLWILGQSEQMKQSISRYFQSPGVFREGGFGILPGEKTQPVGAMDGQPLEPIPSRAQTQMALIQKRELEKSLMKERADALRKHISSSPKLKGLAEQIRIQMTPDGLRIDLPDDKNSEFFEVGSSKPKSTTVELLGLIGKELASVANPLAIEGHTDARPFGRDAAYTNWELSADRANAARRVIEKAGYPADKVEAVRGYADRQLLNADDPLDTRNRRVSFLMRYTVPLPSDSKAAEPEAPPPGETPKKEEEEASAKEPAAQKTTAAESEKSDLKKTLQQIRNSNQKAGKGRVAR